ncbi:hypothetical protein K8I85_15870 [bacterium]|nr:hypothetical protein [bacterium]
MNRNLLAAVLLGAAFVTGCGDDLMVNDGSSSAIPFETTATPRNVVVAAVGLETQPAQLTFQVPAASGADIVSAKFAWVGRGTNPLGDDRILVSGRWRTGTLVASYEVGGELPWVFFYEYDAVGVIKHGNNNFYVSDFQLGSPSRTDGVAAIVVYNDPDSPWTSIHTVNPLEFVSASSGAVWSLPIGGCAQPRNARLVLAAGDCTAAASDRVWWSTGPGASPPDLVGGANVFDDLLGANRGHWMDVLDEPIAVPAYATHFAYQIESLAGGDDVAHLFGAVCIDGEATSCTGEIAGSVWHDEDRDGVRTADETGFEAVPVALRDAGGNELASAMTDADGAFAFRLLCAGDYVVEVDETALPADCASTTCDAGACNPANVMLSTDDASAMLELGWAAPEPDGPSETHCFLGLAFWKWQFGHASGHHARGLGDDVLARIVADVGASTSIDWTRGDGDLSAEDVRDVLHRRRLHRRALVQRSYLVSLLNWALNGADPDMSVDTDGNGSGDMDFGTYMATVESLLGTGDKRSLWRAQRMIRSVNHRRDVGCDLLIPGWSGHSDDDGSDDGGSHDGGCDDDGSDDDSHDGHSGDGHSGGRR